LLGCVALEPTRKPISRIRTVAHHVADKAPAPKASAMTIDTKRLADLVATIPADLSVPPFLDRRIPPPELQEAA
jgi:hypothetical protein